MDVLNVFLLIILIAVYFVLLAVVLADYIMTSMAYYTIAQRRLVSKPWLAWVPVARSWLIGNVTNEYDERNGHRRGWNKVLLISNLITVIGVLAIYIAVIITALISSWGGFIDEEEALLYFCTIYGGVLVAAIAASVYQICKAVCNFKTFESTVPEKALKYLVISIAIPLAQGICLLICRNKGYEYEMYEEEKLFPEECESCDVTSEDIDEEQVNSEEMTEE